MSHPARLARQVAFLEANPSVDVLATVAEYIGPDGAAVDDDWVRTIRRQHDVATTHEQIARVLPITCCLTHGLVLTRAAVLRRAGGYRHEFVPADDYDLWLRLLPRHRFAKLPDRLYSYRVHPQQLGVMNADRQTRHSIRRSWSGSAASSRICLVTRGWRRPGARAAIGSMPRWLQRPALPWCAPTRSGMCWR